MRQVKQATPPGAQDHHWDWQLRSACKGKDDLFFHPDGERDPSRSRRDDAAKAVCAGCPVIMACRAHAFDNNEAYGVWGGMSEDEREEVNFADAARAS